MANTLFSRLAYKSRVLECLLRRGKISAAKLANFARNRLAYRLRRPLPGYHPSVVFIEPSSRCNLSCMGCYNTKRGVYHDTMGDLDPARFEPLFDELAGRTMLASLYWLGEPLLHEGIGRMVEGLTRRKVGSFIASNGMRLDEEMARTLVDAELDMLKIALSGMTQETYSIYHRKGDIGTVLGNVEALAGIIRRRKSPMLVMIDYISFSHNAHEVEAARRHFANLPVHFNVRHGYLTDDKLNPVEGFSQEAPDARRPCDWLWGVSVVNWQGRVFPCCNPAFINGGPALGNLDQGTLADSLRGKAYQGLRQMHLERGRAALPVCSTCFYRNLDFQ